MDPYNPYNTPHRRFQLSYTQQCGFRPNQSYEPPQNALMIITTIPVITITSTDIPNTVITTYHYYSLYITTIISVIIIPVIIVIIRVIIVTIIAIILIIIIIAVIRVRAIIVNIVI